MPDQVIHNEYGEVVFFGKPPSEVSITRDLGESLQTAQQVANAFVRENLPALNLAGVQLEGESTAGGAESLDDVPVVTFTEEKDIVGAKVVVYKQKALDIDVFEARLGVQIDARSMNVASLQSSVHAEIDIQNPAQQADRSGQRRERSAMGQDPRTHLGFDLPELADGICAAPGNLSATSPMQREEPHDHEQLGCLTPGGIDGAPSARPPPSRGWRRGSTTSATKSCSPPRAPVRSRRSTGACWSSRKAATCCICARWSPAPRGWSS